MDCENCENYENWKEKTRKNFKTQLMEGASKLFEQPVLFIQTINVK